jgi:hypothetical protein
VVVQHALRGKQGPARGARGCEAVFCPTCARQAWLCTARQADRQAMRGAALSGGARSGSPRASVASRAG